MDETYLSDSETSDTSSDDDFTLQYSSTESESSCEESDTPLQIRRETFNKNFLWSKAGNFNPVIHEFNDSKAGLNPDLNFNSETKPIEIFEIFYSSEVMEMVCAMTNIYSDMKIESLRESDKLKSNSRFKSWKNLDPTELYTYYALTILMGIIRKPSLKMYWSTDPLLTTPVFAQYMSIRRFSLINTFLHYSDDESTDKLRKIRPMFEILIEKFRYAYRPGENVSIDESLLKYKGRLSFKQCILSKRSRFGIKIYKCCDSENGYIYNASIYVGKDPADENKLIGVSGKVVVKLLVDLSGQGRTLFLDNWYSSPSLFAYLYERKNNVIGTVRTNRKHMPNTKGLKLHKLARNSTLIFHSETLLVVMWKDKKVVTILSTLPGSDFVETSKIDHKTGEKVKKPGVVAKYNKSMGGVDRCDQIIKPYEIERKHYRWYQRIADNLLDMTIYNANIIYNLSHEKKMNHCDFRTQLVRELLEKYSTKSNTGVHRQSKNVSLEKNTHELVKIPTGNENKRKRLRCHNCSEEKKIRVDTTWMCRQCETPLCKNCFDSLH
ncbi:piggyBac transposable element-derived protein 4-like [Leptopilina boulardi]|uniref:piggyBac transposable element-derived protein 4-like n=1 Tax=Leptopilina boulardi TaxID=63433 RepID=UPI0021F647AD|nr:piggyBac transposable element-derived protein 4-like [Leptopilina boulardi]